MKCKECNQLINIEQALDTSPFSWFALGAIWHECNICGTGNHIRFEKERVCLIEVIGAPGPTWEYLKCETNSKADIFYDGEGLKIWLGKKVWFIPYRK